MKPAYGRIYFFVIIITTSVIKIRIVIVIIITTIIIHCCTMSNEQPVALKRRRLSAPEPVTSGKICIVHYPKFSGDTQVRSLTEHSFRTIRNSVMIRQQHTSTSVRLDSICSQIPEEFDDLLHGCHRWCYTNFTNVSKFSSAGDDDNRENGDNSEVCSGSAATRKSGRSAGASAAAEGNSSIGLFPRDQCIFCSSKGRKKVKGKLEKLSTCITETAEMSIKQAAEAKSDFSMLGKVAEIDLRAREARYHESCRKAYVRDDSREHHKAASRTEATEEESSSGLQKTREAHTKAFASICTYIESSLIADGNVERMTMLRDRIVLNRCAGSNIQQGSRSKVKFYHVT